MIEPLPSKITSHKELKQRIAYLESIKDKQEEVLKQNLFEVYKSLQPAELIKSAIQNIRSDEEIGTETGALVGTLGIDFLVGKLFKKDDSIGSFLKTLVARQVLHALYNKYQDKIHGFMENFTDKVVDFFDFGKPGKESTAKEKEEEES